MVPSPIQQANTALAAEYLDWQRKRNRSRETVFVYTDVLTKLLAWIGSIPLATVSTRTLEGFVERPRARRRPAHARGQVIEGSPATRRRDITIIRSFYKYLTERGHLAINPSLLLVPPQVHNIAPRAIDDDVWRAVWCHRSLDDTERIVLALGFFCGLRRQELVDLTPATFDLDGARLVNFTRKGGSQDSFAYGSAVRLISERLHQLAPTGADAVLGQVEQYVQARGSEPYLLAWGDHLGRDDDARLHGRTRLDRYPLGWTPPHVLNKRLRGILRRCGLPEDTFSPHALRHSFVTNLLRAGAPLHVVSRLASHADVATTMRYVKTSEDPLGLVVEDVEHGLHGLNLAIQVEGDHGSARDLGRVWPAAGSKPVDLGQTELRQQIEPRIAEANTGALSARMGSSTHSRITPGSGRMAPVTGVECQGNISKTTIARSLSGGSPVHV